MRKRNFACCLLLNFMCRSSTVEVRDDLTTIYDNFYSVELLKQSCCMPAMLDDTLFIMKS